METRARARFMRGSARKMRQVVDLVRGKPVDQALNMLSMLPKSAAVPVFKTVKSAAANALAAEGTAHLKTENLSIKKIYVDGGPIMKRIRPMGMGRAYRINKRMCHLTVVLEGDADIVATSGPAAKKSTSSAGTAGTKSKTAKKKSAGSARAKAKSSAPSVSKAAAGKSGSTRRPARTKKGS